MTRRELLYGAGVDLLATAPPMSGAISAAASSAIPRSISLSEYEPKSMLQVASTPVTRSRYPVIDFHTHLCWSTKSVNGVALEAQRTFLETSDELLKVMDRTNIQAMVNLTGGYGEGLREGVSQYDRAHKSRFYTLAEPTYEKFLESGYPQAQAQAIAQAHADGARGLKILKTLGLHIWSARLALCQWIRDTLDRRAYGTRQEIPT